MASMSPDMYRGVLNNAKKLKNKAKEYLNGKTTDGLIIPVYFEDELEEMILECENVKANLFSAIKGLKKNSPKEAEYQNALEDIDSVQRELRCYKNKLFR